MLSPSAYLVDLVDFVEDFPALTGAPPGALWSIATRRRANVEHIPLTCENSHTAFPLIDVVNELLEDLVAPPSDTVIWLAPPTTPPGQPARVERRIHREIVRAVRAADRRIFGAGRHACDARSVRCVTEQDRAGPRRGDVTLGTDRWQVIDGGRLLETIRRAGPARDDRHALRRERAATPDRRTERRASRSPRALEPRGVPGSRRQASPRMQLPFDLAHEEGRAYLDELDIKRSDLIGAMNPTELAGGVVDASITRELIGLSRGSAPAHRHHDHCCRALGVQHNRGSPSWTTRIASVPSCFAAPGSTTSSSRP